MTTIYVGNLSYRSTSEQIQELFSRYGEILSVKIINDRDTGRPRGFAFVEMESENAHEAIEKLNGFEFMGRNLKVHEAKERSEMQPRRADERFNRG